MVLCTCPDQDVALSIANALVDGKLAACVNIVPGLRSVYRWKGARENAEEALLIIKSRADDYAPLETAVRALHPYELPEIIAVPICTGLPAYLSWLQRRGEDE
ncbi:MAG: divalent-cation tolerance protein CutA [Gammaproteobacteria bacterium]|nr:divalent-cation tolerance protein CutA [Gammaproteobacteria bacterium]